MAGEFPRINVRRGDQRRAVLRIDNKYCRPTFVMACRMIPVRIKHCCGNMLSCHIASLLSIGSSALIDARYFLRKVPSHGRQERFGGARESR